MKDLELGPEGEPSWEAGLASTLIGGFLMLTACIGMVFNILVASIGRSVMGRLDARLHGIGTTIILACVLWAATCGLRLGLRGSGSLAIAGRSLGATAIVMWLLFAIGQTFVLVPLW